MIKESEGPIDYGFISKYIKEDSKKNNEDETNTSKRFETRNSNSTEVFNTIGAESFSDNNEHNGFYKKKNRDSNEDLNEVSNEVLNKNDEKQEFKFKSPASVEFASKSIIDAKREFLEELENESLSVDICGNITRDWGKK